MTDLFKVLIIVLQAVLFVSFITPVNAMERRRDQFAKEPGHYIVPMPYSVPGIGEGLLVGVLVANAHDSYTDYFGFITTGDVESVTAGIVDMHLINERLIADVVVSKTDKLQIVSYASRGMTSSKDDYILIDLQDNRSAAAQLTGTFYDRMLEIFAGAIQAEGSASRIRDKNGEIIQEADGETDELSIYFAGITLDWTDDHRDPRRGIRYSFSRGWADATPSHSSEFYQQQHNLTGYIPIGRLSTWAFNYFRSDAFVTRTGDTDFSSVEARTGLDCDDPALTAEHQRQCIQAINNLIAHNRYGTVSSIGGGSRLRSYPMGRYRGAHAVFYGTEFRWNLTEEFRPFNIGLAKDIRTGIQLAFFYETASVADTRDKLGDIWRDSYGLGVRLVTASGMVIRGDYATGDEGKELTVIFDYPWGNY